MTFEIKFPKPEIRKSSFLIEEFPTPRLLTACERAGMILLVPMWIPQCLKDVAPDKRLIVGKTWLDGYLAGRGIVDRRDRMAIYMFHDRSKTLRQHAEELIEKFEQKQTFEFIGHTSIGGLNIVYDIERLLENAHHRNG